MSKKKNTLKDLDEFLQQQAASLVSPDALREQMKNSEPLATGKPIAPAQETSSLIEGIREQLETLSKSEGPHFRKKFYDLILNTLEAQTQLLPEDKMLINTVLYLQSGDSWKEAIREYWRKKSKQ